MGLQAAIYCRISQDRKGEGLGVARQERDCREAAGRQRWDVAEVLVDNDTSAYSGKPRPGYRRLLELIEADVIDAVISWSPDRLHRSPVELEEFIDLVEAHKVRVVTVQGGDYDLSTAAGRMSARVVGAVARHESEVKSERNRRKHVELAERGRPSGGGKRPFGYLDDRRTLHATEAPLIRAAVDRILAGDSLRSVVREWQATVPSVTGAPWQGTTVKRLLCSARIAGYREHRGKLAGKADWPAIITPEELARVRAVLRDPTRRKSRTSAWRYLLVGFVHCGRCGARMTSRATGKGVRRYVCQADRGCGRCGIAAEPLEELIAEAVLSRFDDVPIPTRRPSEHDDRAAEVAELEQRLADLAEDYGAGLLSRVELRVAGERLRERLDAARSVLAESLTDSGIGSTIGGDPGALRRAWPTLTFDRRRAVLGLAVEKVTIAPTTRATNYFDAGRVDLTWRT